MKKIINILSNMPRKYLVILGIIVLVAGVATYNTIHDYMLKSQSQEEEQVNQDEIEILGDKPKGFDTKEEEYIAKTKTVEDLLRKISNGSYDVPYLFTKAGFGIEPMKMTSNERMLAAEAVQRYFLNGDVFYNARITKIDRGKKKVDTFHIEVLIQQVNFLETRQFKIQVNQYAQIVTPIEQIPQGQEEVPVD
jgi:anti-sigma28 factor (negative regulator of flagellin synthesis)/NADPH-dependent 7-cyano-7-deazaguanine reductase QueF-like protein